MANFKLAYSITREFEGEYSNHPKDAGGETYKGIARNSHPNWQGWSLIDSYKSKPNFPKNLRDSHMLIDYVHDFYKKEYWDVMNLDDVENQDIANELFDTGVNMGIKRAAVFLQRVLNVSNKCERLFQNLKVDGNIGKITVSSLNSHPEQENILLGLNALQGALYITICESNPSQEVFFNGWIKRCKIHK